MKNSSLKLFLSWAWGNISHALHHDWGQWDNIGTPGYVSYPWTRAGCFAYVQQSQMRQCHKCGFTETRYIKW